MVFKKKIGKLKFELKLTRMQVIVIFIWICLLLLLPIFFHQFSVLNSETPTTQSQQEGEIAGIFNSNQGFFNYTVDISNQESLISSLTLIFGILSGIVAIGSLIYIIKERISKNDIQK